MIEIAAWYTSLANARLSILDVGYNTFDGGQDFLPGYAYAAQRNDGFDLTVRVFNWNDETIYRIGFANISAYRLLDEHGLDAFWKLDRETRSTFRARGHLWVEESPVSFAMGDRDGWSYVIATDWECVEVVGAKPPEITPEGKLQKATSA